MTPVDDPKQPIDQFSERERTILSLMADGLSNQEIADRLFLALTTVKWYIRQINDKLDTHTRTQTLARARQLKLISDEYTAASPNEAIEPLENPYKGLQSFQEADAKDFFGRDTLVERLLLRLSETSVMSPFLALVGPSGCGKSSVVQADLVPALRQGKLPAFQNGLVAQITPGAHPLEELEIALLRIAPNPPASLLPQLREDERGLLRAARRVLPDNNKKILLVIDQFEELFTLVESPAERQQFLNLLLAAVTENRSPLYVVITLRADFYDRPLLFSGFGELIRQRTEVVLPLTAIELEQAISRPAARAGVALESGLVVAMVAEANQQPGELPLLQYALTELFDYVQGGTMTLEAYRAVGGMLGALTRRADSLCDAFDQHGQEAIRQLFLRLVTLGEGVEDTRRRVLMTELLSMSLGVQQTDDFINTFAAYRLLTLDHDPVTHSATVELAHEALIREWKRLRSWLDDSRADIRLQRLLAEATLQWIKSNRDNSFLLSGSRLAQFESWAQDTDVALTRDERGYLEASLNEREKLAAQERIRYQRELQLERRSRNFLRGLVAVLMIATFGALILSGIAVNQSNVAQKARATSDANAMLANARELAAAAINNLSLDPELSLLLALRAVKITYDLNGTWTREAEEALHRAAGTSQSRLVLQGHKGVVFDVVYSSDGNRVASASIDGTAKIWDVKTGQEVITLRQSDATNSDSVGTSSQTIVNHDVYSVVFSPDGARLATGSRDGTAVIWDISTGKPLTIFRPTDTTLNVAAVAFSPNGKQFALFATNLNVSSEHVWEVKVWDLTSGSVSFTASSDLSTVLTNTGILGGTWGGITFSPDNSQIAFATSDNVVEIWTLFNRQKLLTLSGHTNIIQQVVFSPDGKFLATISLDGTAKLWDIATPLSIGATSTIAALQLPGIYGIAFSPDGKRIVTASSDGLIKVWDASSGALLFTLSGHSGTVQSVAFDPNGLEIATAGADKTVRLWKAAPGGEVYTLNTNVSVNVAYSPDGSRFATESGNEVLEYDARTGEQVLSFTPPAIPGWVSFSPDGRRLVTSGDLGRVWDAKTGQLLLTLPGAIDGSHEIVYSPDGKLIASGGHNKILRIWNGATGNELVELSGHKSGIHCINFSPDGKYLVSGGESAEAIVWNLTTDQPLFTIFAQGPAVRSDLFSPDGKRLLISSNGEIAEIWDVSTQKLLMSLGGHPGSVNDAVYSPDGKYIATTGGTITKLWDAATGQEMLTLYGHTGDINRVVFSPNGKHLITNGFDLTLRVYTLSIGDLLTLAQSKVNRSFTPDECQRYLHIDSCPP